jgi:hypothetical protein
MIDCAKRSNAASSGSLIWLISSTACRRSAEARASTSISIVSAANLWVYFGLLAQFREFVGPGMSLPHPRVCIGGTEPIDGARHSSCGATQGVGRACESPAIRRATAYPACTREAKPPHSMLDDNRRKAVAAV